MSSEPSPRRLHPVAMLIGAIKTIRRWIGAVAIPGVAAIAGGGLRMQALVFLGIFVVVAGSALWGFLSWRATTYGVSRGAFVLRGGVLRKNERTIPLEHVQSVDTVQGIIQRVFGVVEVRVETASGGGNQPEASLPALGHAAAEALRREIEGSRQEPVEEAGPVVVRRLGTRDLLVAGATSGQIGVALSLIAVASQLFDEFLPEDLAERLIATLAPRSLADALVLIPAFGLLAWILAIAGTILAYAGFTLSRDGDFLRIRRGFLERREATIPLSRIQAVRISEGVLRQPFGLAMLRVESAGYGEDAGVSTTLFPLLPRKEAQGLLLDAAPEFAVEPSLNPLPVRALRRYVFRAALPALLLAAIVGTNIALALDSVAWASLGLLLLLPAIPYGWLRYRAAGWTLAGDRLVIRSRLLARTTAIAPRRRLQSRSLVRSPFQRRARLATFRARVASGGGGAAFQVVDLESVSADSLAERLGPGRRAA
jgi:putative membrane protein